MKRSSWQYPGTTINASRNIAPAPGRRCRGQAWRRRALAFLLIAFCGVFQTASGDASGADDTAWHEQTVAPGDTLAAIMTREGISRTTVHHLTNSNEHGSRLARLRPGERIRMAIDDEGELAQVIYEPSTTERLTFHRTETGFSARQSEIPLQRHIRQASGSVRSSLMQAGAAAGLSDAITLGIAEIFAWDIDFALDLRRGDRFHVLYEALYRDGEHVADGDILAVRFINRGRTFDALRYRDPDGETAYYAPDGTAIRRAFLRAPVEYTRITSGFGPRRHPELHEMRDHNGVDYAAPPGTPIRATADGRIVQRGWNGGYGRAVVIQHGERYRTLYAHLSRFRDGVGHGARVEQGDIIGYVGESGLATGPHVHYELLIDGVHRDPETVELPSGEPVADEHREHFAATTKPLGAQLETLERASAAVDQ